jgi:hypothetical protein
MPFSNANNIGSYIETTQILSDDEIRNLNPNDPKLKEYLIKLQEKINLIALVLNTKESGFYSLDEFVTGNLYFPDPANLTRSSPSGVAPNYRNTFRVTINFGQLPNNTTKSVAHGISFQASNAPLNYNGYTLVSTTGGASDTTARLYIPIPFPHATGAASISMDIDATNVTITTNNNRTNFNDCKIVLEFLKS